jgi:hypothetical protein
MTTNPDESKKQPIAIFVIADGSVCFLDWRDQIMVISGACKYEPGLFPRQRGSPCSSLQPSDMVE